MGRCSQSPRVSASNIPRQICVGCPPVEDSGSTLPRYRRRVPSRGCARSEQVHWTETTPHAVIGTVQDRRSYSSSGTDTGLSASLGTLSSRVSRRVVLPQQVADASNPRPVTRPRTWMGRRRPRWSRCRGCARSRPQIRTASRGSRTNHPHQGTVGAGESVRSRRWRWPVAIARSRTMVQDPAVTAFFASMGQCG